MTGSSRQKFPAYLCCAYLGILWLWTASACWREWKGNSDYSYGWLVFPLSIYFAWKRLTPQPRSATSGRLARVASLGLFLPALAALPLELLRLAPLFWLAVPWMIFLVAAVGTLSLACLYGGKPWLAGALFPVVLAATAIPWPAFVESAVNVRLMAWVAGTVTEWLHLCGIPAERNGLVIFLPHCVIGIERACSGLRSVQASIMTGLVAGELFALRVPRRLLLLALSPYLALLANLARTFTISVAGYCGGSGTASAWHGPSGMVAMTGLVVVIIGLGWLMRSPEKPAVTPDTAQRQLPSFQRTILVAIICLLAPIGAAQFWYQAHAVSAPDNPLLEAGEGIPPEKIMQLPVPPEIESELVPSQGIYLDVDYPPFGRMQGYHFFWRQSLDAVNQLYHRPDVCMPGAGWKPLAPPRPFQVEIGGRETDWHVFQYEQGGTKADLIWGAWLGGRPISFSLDSRKSLQGRLMWQLVTSGIRNTTYEVAAVLVPRTGVPLTDADAAEIISHTFSWNANPPRP